MLEGGLLRNSYMVECGNTNAMHWAHCLVHVHGRPLCPTLGVPVENRPKIKKRQILKRKVIAFTTTIRVQIYFLMIGNPIIYLRNSIYIVNYCEN